MAWTNPRTWTVGELATASLMNLHVRDNLTFLEILCQTPPYRGAAATNSGAQTITTATWTKVSLQTEVWDTDGDFDNATNYRWTAPATCKVQALGLAEIGSFANAAYVAIYRNGSEFARAGYNPSLTADNALAVKTQAILNSGQYLELYVHHTSGGDRSLTAGKALLAVHRID